MSHQPQKALHFSLEYARDTDTVTVLLSSDEYVLLQRIMELAPEVDQSITGVSYDNLERISALVENASVAAGGNRTIHLPKSDFLLLASALEGTASVDPDDYFKDLGPLPSDDEMNKVAAHFSNSIDRLEP